MQPQAAAECGGQAKIDKEVNKVVDEDDTKAKDKELVKELDEG